MRRCHRWLGLSAILFVVLLSVTGIALNHGDGWRLGERHIDWDWLLDAYGIRMPAPSASYADDAHRATLIDTRLYLDRIPVAEDATELTGLVSLPGLVAVATESRVLVFTPGHELVEQLDISTSLPGPVNRIGRTDDRMALESQALHFVSDTQLTGFEPWPESAQADVSWSSASAVPAADLEFLRQDYRGRGLSIERVLLDVHSGRIVGRLGPLVLDVIALFLLVLALSGLLLWFRRRGQPARNGRR